MGGTSSVPQPAAAAYTPTTTRTTTSTGQWSVRGGGLVRMYGYFRCPTCRQQWESSHVYCMQGTLPAAYGQECKKCRVTCMPYRVEQIICSQCGQTPCICLKEKRERHVDPNKHHRRELCAKCQAGIPCTRGY